MAEQKKEGACRVNQRYNAKGDKVIEVSCPLSAATYVVASRPTLTLTSYGANSSGGIDEKAKTDITFDTNSFKMFSKNESGKETVKLNKAVFLTNRLASVYCDSAWASTGALFFDRWWLNTVNASPEVTKSIFADQVQEYARRHPDVIAEILKVKPVIAISEKGGVTLEEVLNMPSPQFAACPRDEQSKKDGIVIEKRVRN